ncbi:unnamed protein product, partial [Brassica oleracea var. botrytis]
RHLIIHLDKSFSLAATRVIEDSNSAFHLFQKADSNLCFTLSNRSLGIVFVLRSIATSDLHLRSGVPVNIKRVSEKYRWKRRKLQSMKQSRKSLKLSTGETWQCSNACVM